MRNFLGPHLSEIRDEFRTLWRCVRDTLIEVSRHCRLEDFSVLFSLDFTSIVLSIPIFNFILDIIWDTSFEESVRGFYRHTSFFMVIIG